MVQFNRLAATGDSSLSQRRMGTYCAYVAEQTSSRKDGVEFGGLLLLHNPKAVMSVKWRLNAAVLISC